MDREMTSGNSGVGRPDAVRSFTVFEGMPWACVWEIVRSFKVARKSSSSRVGVDGGRNY